MNLVKAWIFKCFFYALIIFLFMEQIKCYVGETIFLEWHEIKCVSIIAGRWTCPTFIIFMFLNRFVIFFYYLIWRRLDDSLVIVFEWNQQITWKFFSWTQRLNETESARFEIKSIVIRCGGKVLHTFTSILTCNLHSTFVNSICLLDPLEPFILLFKSHIVYPLFDLSLNADLHLLTEHFKIWSQVLPWLHKEWHLLLYVSQINLSCLGNTL